MGKIEKILKKGPVEGQTTEVYPVTSTKAVYDENNKRLDNIITGLQESVYLNNPIPISTEDTPEANAQNVKNITNYIEKAKAAGIEDVNGMAVTCIINDAYSGVGYIMGNTDVAILGIKITDDLVNNTAFIIYGGVYFERTVIAVGTSNKVDSDMLNEGARKPIILTPNTTEIDEETYQKLLSDDVDVMFKDAVDIFYYIYDIDNMVSELEIRFVTTLGSFDTTDPSDYWFSVAYVRISKNAPHTVTTESSDHSLQDVLNNYLNKSVLTPVLKNINLADTDAERKAKLDQFEVDWKTLTGASDLNGARFVGNVSMNDGATTNVLLSMDQDGNYSGISMSDDVDVSHLKKIVVLPHNGSVISTPLFSHLEAITIQPGNGDANVAAIKAYIDNLRGLGFASEKGCIIPVIYIEEQQEYYGSLFYKKDTSRLKGIVSKKLGAGYYNLSVDKNDGSTSFDVEDPVIFDSGLSPIKASIEFLATCVNFTDTPSSNKTLLELYLDTVPNATVMHCTYKDVYAGTLYKINSDWYGLLVKNTNNPADNINVKLSADGTIIVNSSTQ